LGDLRKIIRGETGKVRAIIGGQFLPKGVRPKARVENSEKQYRDWKKNSGGDWPVRGNKKKEKGVEAKFKESRKRRKSKGEEPSLLRPLSRGNKGLEYQGGGGVYTLK